MKHIIAKIYILVLSCLACHGDMIPLAVNEKIKVMEGVMNHETFQNNVDHKSRLISDTKFSIPSLSSLSEDGLIDEIVANSFDKHEEGEWIESIKSRFQMLNSNEINFPIIVKISDIKLLDNNRVVGFILFQYTGKGEKLLFYDGELTNRNNAAIEIHRCEVIMNITYKK